MASANVSGCFGVRIERAIWFGAQTYRNLGQVHVYK